MADVSDPSDKPEETSIPETPEKPRRESTPHPSFSEEFGNALEYAWGPVLISVLFSAALALPDASHEALMSVAENAMRPPVGSVAALFTLIAFFFLPPTLHLSTKYALETPRHFQKHNAQVERVLLTWVGRLPLLAASVAILRVLFGEDHISLGATAFLILLLVLSLSLTLSGIWVFLPEKTRNRLAGAVSRGRVSAASQPSDPAGPITRRLAALYGLQRRVGIDYRPHALAACAVILVLLAIFPLWSVWLGPVAVAIIFVSVAAQCLAFLTRQSVRLSYGQIPLILVVMGLVMAGTGRPGSIAFLILAALYGLAVFIHPARASWPERITAAMILALAIGLTAWGYKRQDRCPVLAGCYLVETAPPETAPAAMADAYPVWLAQRAAEAPVRLIAAEGGGLFSAYYTALYLAKRADAEGPDFTDSIFAISGVSGGSVGAAAFWAIRASGACEDAPRGDDCHQRIARAILGRDYLSPVLARLFTTDLADTILPFSSVTDGARLDRARQLELALTGHSVAAAGDGAMALARPLAASWTPEARLPALFLNTTRVAAGDRVILSPFTDLSPDESSGGIDGPAIEVATAAFMSARFPIVTAAARVATGTGIQQIVDGGYFDNSGIETIHDILNIIRPATPNPVEVIVLTTEDPATASGDTSRLKGTFGTPLSAFLGAWHSRMVLSQRRTSAAFEDQGDGTGRTTTITPFALRLRDLNYTVSWYLDRNSFCRIEANLNTDLEPVLAEADPAVLTRPANCGD
ncbi:hypothetical protein [Paracoccus marinaquae]|uniref:PNPLA domain-containing protein n=1 Tax=Paracoccus marinaquae TaxID=2841926 RepID=A0ABS6AFP1_9RHOB|nr:hypothetical protein [Paracoccus marinaquae]MBU3029417.1 hypothetical protein [Paracoccus marinaquae]